MAVGALNRAGGVGPLAGMLVPVAGSSDFLAVGATEADTSLTLTAADLYVLTCDIDCYFKQGAAPVAAEAADGSMYVPAGMPILIDGAQGAKVSLIRKGSSDGVATLQKMVLLR